MLHSFAIGASFHWLLALDRLCWRSIILQDISSSMSMSVLNKGAGHCLPFVHPSFGFHFETPPVGRPVAPGKFNMEPENGQFGLFCFTTGWFSGSIWFHVNFPGCSRFNQFSYLAGQSAVYSAQAPRRPPARAPAPATVRTRRTRLRQRRRRHPPSRRRTGHRVRSWAPNRKSPVRRF